MPHFLPIMDQCATSLLAMKIQVVLTKSRGPTSAQHLPFRVKLSFVKSVNPIACVRSLNYNMSPDIYDHVHRTRPPTVAWHRNTWHTSTRYFDIAVRQVIGLSFSRLGGFKKTLCESLRQLRSTFPIKVETLCDCWIVYVHRTTDDRVQFWTVYNGIWSVANSRP